MRNRDLQKEIWDGVLDTDEARVSELLGSLKTVDAPANFDRTLRERIASASAARYRRFPLFATLKYALPLLLVLLIGGAIIFKDALTLRPANVPTVAESTSPEKSLPSVPEAPPVTSDGASEQRPETAVAAADQPKQEFSTTRKRRFTTITTPRRSAPNGGSADKTLSGPRKIIWPKGLDPRGIEERENAIDSSGKLTVKEILSEIGIEAAGNGYVWNVRSVTKNSVADRTGVKAGDVMLSIDGRALDDKAIFIGPAGVKNIGVRREGKTIVLPLQVQK